MPIGCSNICLSRLHKIHAIRRLFFFCKMNVCSISAMKINGMKWTEKPAYEKSYAQRQFRRSYKCQNKIGNKTNTILFLCCDCTLGSAINYAVEFVLGHCIATVCPVRLLLNRLLLPIIFYNQNLAAFINYYLFASKRLAVNYKVFFPSC